VSSYLYLEIMESSSMIARLSIILILVDGIAINKPDNLDPNLAHLTVDDMLY
jgi:hypothetical protein